MATQIQHQSNANLGQIGLMSIQDQLAAQLAQPIYYSIASHGSICQSIPWPFCQPITKSTNLEPIHCKYAYFKQIHPQSVYQNSITKSNDNLPILDQDANPIPILKQSASLLDFLTMSF